MTPDIDGARTLVSRFPLQDDSLPLPGADLEQFHGKRRDSRRDDKTTKPQNDKPYEHQNQERPTQLPESL